jgi:hypothetical protein
VPVLLDIAGIIAPLIVIAGIGFVWGRSDHPFDTNMIGALVVNFGVPCLIFSTLTRLKVSPAVFGEIAGIYILALASVMLIGALVLRLLRYDVGAFLPGITFANNGNMGLPLCLFAFGDDGLAIGISVFVVSAVGNFTFGTSMVSGQISPRAIVKSPQIWVVAAALVFIGYDITPPVWLANTTQIIGGMSIPLMLIALGVSLSRLKVSSLPQSLILSALRLVLGFTVGVVVSWAFGLEGAERGVIILQCSMPAAVLNYIIAARYDRAPGEVAGLVVCSTLLSFLTLPALLYFVL